MVSSTEFMLVLRCPTCGEYLLLREYSIFTLRDGVDIFCTCGEEVGAVGIDEFNQLELLVFGPCCEDEHYFYYSLKEILQEECSTLTCHKTNMNLGYIGSRGEVIKALISEAMGLIILADEAREYFYDAKLTGEALQKIYSLYELGEICCCHCFVEDINVKIGKNFIDITCPNCTLGGRIDIRDVEKIKELQSAEGILLFTDSLFMVQAEDIPKKV